MNGDYSLIHVPVEAVIKWDDLILPVKEVPVDKVHIVQQGQVGLVPGQ